MLDEQEYATERTQRTSMADFRMAQFHSPVHYAQAFLIRLAVGVIVSLVFDVLLTLTVEHATLRTFGDDILWTMLYTCVAILLVLSLWYKLLPTLWNVFSTQHIVLQEKGMYRIETKFPRIWQKTVTFIPASSQQPKEAKEITKILEDL